MTPNPGEPAKAATQAKRSRAKRSQLEHAPPSPAPALTQHVLRLYVAGCTVRTAQAVANLKAICEEHLNGCYQLDVVDIYQQPALAKRDQVIAVPTLIRQLPKPLRRIVGDMSRRERVLVGLDLLPGIRIA